jgi:hypothetical protein
VTSSSFARIPINYLRTGAQDTINLTISFPYTGTVYSAPLWMPNWNPARSKFNLNEDRFYLAKYKIKKILGIEVPIRKKKLAKPLMVLS